MVLKTSNQNAVQDTEIVALKEAQASSVDTMRELNKSVQALDKNVAVLNERLKER